MVSALGAGVTDFRVGEEVFGVLEAGREGAYAEKIAIGAAIVAKIVKVMPSEYKRILSERATMPETAGRPATQAEPKPYVPSGAWERPVVERRMAHG